MRSVKRTADSAATPTFSSWVRLSHYSYDYNVGFICSPHTGTTGTYSVQVSESNPEDFEKAQFTRVTTTLTINTLSAHGLSTGDGVNLRGSTSWDTSGQSLQVTVSDADTFTVTVADTGAASGVLEYAPIVITDLTNYSAVSGRQQGTIVGATQLVRIAKVSGTLSGKVTIEVTQAGN